MNTELKQCLKHREENLGLTQRVCGSASALLGSFTFLCTKAASRLIQQQGEEMSAPSSTLHSLETEKVALKKKILPSLNFFYDPQKKILQTIRSVWGSEVMSLQTSHRVQVLVKHATYTSPDTQYVQLVVPEPTLD